jgi:hypothetical protein
MKPNIFSSASICVRRRFHWYLHFLGALGVLAGFDESTWQAGPAATGRG